MPPLDGTVPLEEVHDVSRLVSHDLHLDVSRMLNEALNEDVAVAECLHRFRVSTFKLLGNILQPKSFG